MRTDIILAVVLVLCAGFAGLEAVTMGAAAQFAMHQIYAARWPGWRLSTLCAARRNGWMIR